ncbi:M3 family metallopeptidase [Parasphingopyxis sp.]|uniref:M3 family metallopeptidase n=1 Tax=Parasphingopyxis sp. TaxID=1920299 RepID=UPI00261E2854|nr:M3 family metallopeptidase [Parasphingopyxis sp.]
MKAIWIYSSAATLALGAAGVTAPAHATEAQSETSDQSAAETAANPLLSESPLPFGAPQFDSLTPQHYAEAMERGMTENMAEVQRIANAETAPTFDNTIAAMEGTGNLLTQASLLFFNMASANTNDDIQEIQREFAPRLAAHNNAISLDPALFERVRTIYDQRDTLDLDAEQLRLVERYYTSFTRQGALLEGEARERFAEINERLATLSTLFSQNMINDTGQWTLLLDSEDDLAGLPDTLRAAAARAAADAGHEGQWMITLQRSSVEPFLQFSERRDLRRQAFEAWAARGDNDDAEDNNAIIAETLRLRTERSRLLGYDSFAEFQLADRMARTPQAARDLIERVWTPALARAEEERDAINSIRAAEGADDALAPWDWRYYAERVRQERFNLSQAELRPYFELDNMIAAQFYVAEQLFGLQFEERDDLPVYHPTVRVWEVKDSAGEHIGLFYGDYIARPNKRSGAWMSSYRQQDNLDGETTPIIVNVLSVSGGEPTLLSYNDAETLFHEFGHALHGLLSNVRYPTLSGTSVATDFVEFPAQIYEHWLLTPEVLSRFARHHETDEPMPQELVDRLMASRTFNQGFATVEFLASAFVDLDFHDLTSVPEDFDVGAFEEQTLARIGMPDEMVMRHRPPHFGHIFAGGYSAGYYAYLWSEILDADGFDAFTETGNVFDPATAERLYRFVYSGGNTRDWTEAYVGFRGREPSVEPLLRNRGFGD